MFEWVTDIWTGNCYHPWSVSWTTMPACLQTCNWKQRVALGRRGPAATTGSGTSSELRWSCSLSESPFTPVSMGHGVRNVTGHAGWKTLPLHNNLSVTDDAEEALPMATFALRLLNSRWSQKTSDFETGDWNHTIISPMICAAGYELVSQWQVNKPMRYSHWKEMEQVQHRQLCSLWAYRHWFLPSGGGCCCWNCILIPSQKSPLPSKESCDGQELGGMKAGRVCPLLSQRFRGFREDKEPEIKWNILNE